MSSVKTNKVKEKVFTWIRNIPYLKKVLYLISFCVCVFLILSIFCPPVKRVAGIIGYVMFLVTIPSAGFFTYAFIESDYASKLNTNAEETSDFNYKKLEDVNLTVDPIENYENIATHESVSRSTIYKSMMTVRNEKTKELDENEFSETITLCKFSNPALPEEIAFSTAGMCYIFDTPTFKMLQSYVEDYGYEIIDIPFSKHLKERNEALRVIANAINFRKCYVTQKILEEITLEEEKGTIRNGTSSFVKDYFGVVENEDVLPEGKNWKDVLNADNDEKDYEDCHYKLIWDAMKFSGGEHSKVFIVTPKKDFIELGKANDIEIVNPWKIEYSS